MQDKKDKIDLLMEFITKEFESISDRLDKIEKSLNENVRVTNVVYTQTEKLTEMSNFVVEKVEDIETLKKITLKNVYDIEKVKNKIS